MASSFSTDLKLELMVTGENSGTWGDKTNTNLNLLQQAIAGYQSIAITSTNTTLVMTDATISDARNAVIEFTGTITANATVFIASGIEKTYTIKNSTTGAFTLALNQVGGSSVIWGATEKNIKGVYLNGTNANTIDLSTLGGQISTSTALADFVVGPNELDTSSVTEVKIASSAVTSTKIASFAVTSGALDTASVTSVKIASAAVGPTQLQNTSVTAGSFTVASITVDAQGRITAASSGSAGDPTPLLRFSAKGPGSGTYTAQPGTTNIAVIMNGGGGGGAPSPDGFGSSGGGNGGFGLLLTPVSPGFSAPYAVGGGGPAGGSGGQSTFNTNFTAGGGNTGSRNPARIPGNAGAVSGATQDFNPLGSGGGVGPGSLGNMGLSVATLYYGPAGTNFSTGATRVPQLGFVVDNIFPYSPSNSLSAGGVGGGGGQGNCCGRQASGQTGGVGSILIIEK